MPKVPKYRTMSGTPIAATVSASFTRPVPSVPYCTKTISASLSRRSPNGPWATQRPRQRPVMSKPCTATGSTGVALAATLTKPGSSGTSRPHHASRAAAAVWASVMLALVGWLLAEKARWRAEAKCAWCPDQCCQASDAQPDIENMTAESRSNHHCRRSISRPPAIEPRPDTDRIAPEVQGEDHGARRNISLSLASVRGRSVPLWPRAASQVSVGRRCYPPGHGSLARSAAAAGARRPPLAARPGRPPRGGAAVRHGRPRGPAARHAPQLPGSPRLRLRHGGARDPGAQHERAQPRRAPRGDAADPGARQGRVREDARRRRPAGGGGRRGGGAGLLPARRRRRPGGRGGRVGGRDANHERGDLRAAARARRGVGARDARRAGGAARPRLTHFSFGESFGASAGESFGVSLGFAGAS